MVAVYGKLVPAILLLGPAYYLNVQVTSLKGGTQVNSYLIIFFIFFCIRCVLAFLIHFFFNALTFTSFTGNISNLLFENCLINTHFKIYFYWCHYDDRSISIRNFFYFIFGVRLLLLSPESLKICSFKILLINTRFKLIWIDEPIDVRNLNLRNFHFFMVLVLPRIW